ncbi:acyl carrier protein [Saccharomonospora sp.]|uniref:acyl carrier protein n=1 Tax=Saccharomonospora sp. TaxID=33913 RepID=UPI00261FD310|nr:acyl carrier protein [Saccharomonospora sp.]
MAAEEITSKLIDIIADIGDIPRDEVQNEKYLIDDLDIDSLSLVEIGATIEDDLGVAIPDDKLAELKSVGDLVDYVTQQAIPS